MCSENRERIDRENQILESQLDKRKVADTFE